MVHAIDAGGGGVQDAQERPGSAAGAPSTGASGGGSHPGGVPGLLPDRDAASEAGPPRAGPDAPTGARKPAMHPNGGRAPADDGWAGVDHAAIHRAGDGPEDHPGEAGIEPAATTPAADPQRRLGPGVRIRAGFVVQTSGVKSAFSACPPRSEGRSAKVRLAASSILRMPGVGANICQRPSDAASRSTPTRLCRSKWRSRPDRQMPALLTVKSSPRTILVWRRPSNAKVTRYSPCNPRSREG